MKKVGLLALLLILGIQVVVFGIQTFRSEDYQLVNQTNNTVDFGRKPSSVDEGIPQEDLYYPDQKK